MLYLTENENTYLIKCDRYLDKSDWSLISNNLKSLYIFYDKDLNGWKIKKQNSWENILYIEKVLGYKINRMGIEIQKYNSIPQETIFERKSSFDPSSIKVNLFDYQKEDVEWALKRNRAFIASDPGVGKTIEAISIFSSLYNNKKIDGIFIVVKNNLTFHWEKEILDFSFSFQESDILIVTNKNKRELFNSSSIYEKKIIICPNHLIGDMIDEYSSFSFKRLWEKNDLCIIVDECHEFKNSKAKRTKILSGLLDEFKYRYLLSATPAINGFSDWYTQITFLDKSIIPFSEKAFRLDIAKYIGDKFDPFAVKQYEPEMVKLYIEKFKPWVRKRVKTDLPEVKSKQFIKPVYFELSTKHKDIIRMIKSFYLEKIEINNGVISFKQIQDKFPYLCLAIDNPSLLKDRIKDEDKNDKFDFKPLENLLNNWTLEDFTKIQYLKDFLKEKIKVQKQKVIIFDTHPHTLDQLYEYFEDYKPLIIHGKTKDSMEDRQRKVDIFNDKYSDNKLFLLNVQTGGTGLNLHKACNTIIFLNLPWDATLLRQGMDRTHRVTSENDTFVEILTYGKSIDEQRCKKNLKRVQFNDEIFKDDLEIDLIN